MGANDAFKQPSNIINRFSRVPQANIPRSIFNLNHTHKGTFQEAGLLIPFDHYEVLPGDTFKIKPTIFCRLTTQLVPIMDNMYLDTFYFFVPYRLLWTNWERFMGERDPNPTSSIDYTVPQYNSAAGGFPVNSPQDCLGLPSLVAVAKSVSAFPGRAYILIWNDWFRDENIQDSISYNTDNGPDTGTTYTTLRRRGKRFDYFTSCLPNPQKGTTAVSLPLGTSAPVLGIGMENTVYATATKTAYESDGTTSVYAQAKLIDGAGGVNTQVWVEQNPTNTSYPYIRADLSTATAATINQLRQAFQVQALLERDARGGTRYNEMVLAHFGVSPGDDRIQRPQFLGGDSVAFNQQTVAQTTYQGTETRTDAKGALAANSIFVSSSKGITHSFTEHGMIMGILCVRADLTYSQGIEKHWLRSTRYDYYFPSFAHLGEQTVQSQEIYFDGTGSASANPPTGDYSVFGYQERWAEYRYAKSLITGYLRSDAAGTLDYWHLSEDFGSRPTLSDTFISHDPPIERITGITPSATSPAFMYDAYIECKAVRPLPAYSIPFNFGRF